jgi:hypothetical protein
MLVCIEIITNVISERSYVRMKILVEVLGILLQVHGRDVALAGACTSSRL